MKVKNTLALTILFTLVFILQSCENKKQKNIMESNSSTVDAVNKIDTLQNDQPEIKEIYYEEQEIVYPKTGNKASDFLPKSGVYKIQYEAKGDLNNDGKDDIAIVLAHKEIKTLERPMLVLLQNDDKSFRLDKVSTLVMPVEYSGDDYKMYTEQDVNIENGILKIQLYGSGGPVGNIFSHFEYSGNDLVLTYIETYNSGAGSWQDLHFDLKKGLLTQEVTSTMTEDMPSESKTFKLEKEKHLFEDTSPDDVIMEVYKKTDISW
ncbi:hypothetical protein HNQ02_003274 [Flavobacterium sp. 7E]|uniref:hypothetical protein n=1 Tax=Flavobacterium sp. 7E TaxID=2735898 RepID=UPI00156EA47B|nr:hypothetical protein [Flavobacterium sp. 7E]NRS90334.1 hypothetical protein [Flavobacterium sp. 7E]